MRPRSWFTVYVPMTAAALLVAFILHRVIGIVHLSALLVISVVVPFVLALIGGRASHDVQPPPAREPLGFAQWPLVPVWFGIALLKFAAIGYFATQFAPTLHDEWSYLFGAETIARGRLSNDPPPQPDFFDAFHILTKPRWMTRYPPGHPAVLAIGLIGGAAWVAVIAMVSGTVLATYLLGRCVGGAASGWIAGVLALLSPGLDYLASGYLSQSTFLFMMTGCVVSTLYAVRRASPALAALGGLLGAWAIATRPYSAAALGLPLAIWFVVRCVRAGKTGDSEPPPAPRSSKWITLACAVAAIAASLVILASYNERTMDSPWRFAWQEYNRQFEPDNQLGVRAGPATPIPEAMHYRKRQKAFEIAAEKQAFTAREAVRRALADPKRLSQMVFPAIGFCGLLAFLPFAFVGEPVKSTRSRECKIVLLCSIVAHYAAYSLFYSTWGAYGLETIPFLIVLVACGVHGFWQTARDSDRPALVLTAPLAGAAAIGLLAFIQLPRFIEERAADTAVHRQFQATIGPEAARGPILVFVTIPSDSMAQYDLIHNSPDLGSRVIVVLDLGDRNASLVAQFPDHRAFVYEQATGAMRPWLRPAPQSPAKLPSRPSTQVASSHSALGDRSLAVPSVERPASRCLMAAHGAGTMEAIVESATAAATPHWNLFEPCR